MQTRFKKKAKVFDIGVTAVAAVLYNIDIMLEPRDEFTDFMLTEIWIRPTITYGLVACFVTEQAKQ